jgi:hypothetical protein
MAVNPNNAPRNLLTPDLVLKMSGLLGEPPLLTKKAIDLMVSSLTDAVYQAASTSTGANALTQFLRPCGSDSKFPSMITCLLNLGNISKVVLIGEKLLSIVLGDNTDQVVRSIARAAGVSDLSASALLHLASPLVLASLSKLPSGQHETASPKLFTR